MTFKFDSILIVESYIYKDSQKNLSDFIRTEIPEEEPKPIEKNPSFASNASNDEEFMFQMDKGGQREYLQNKKIKKANNSFFI